LLAKPTNATEPAVWTRCAWPELFTAIMPPRQIFSLGAIG
jgi:hypothetical protein